MQVRALQLRVAKLQAQGLCMQHLVCAAVLAKDPSTAAQGHGWQTGCNKGLQQSHAQLAHNAS
jgi:hypothetical protein